MDRAKFSAKLIEWYLQHHRDLPWRRTTDPYKIWLSEIILQQTRVIQGLPYYLKFLEHFPDVGALAGAEEQEILRLWQGLGYYTRARNVHKCAKYVVSKHGGRFPSNYRELLDLPGVGEYTAAAIASFCFREKVAVVDGNVFRVLSRITGDPSPTNSPAGRTFFIEQANQLISAQHPDLHNQAIMEFGATWCTPKSPRCEECIFKKECAAFRLSMQDQLPVKLKIKKARKRYFNYFVIQKGKSLLMKKRSGKDIWNGLFDFYLVETRSSAKPMDVIKKDTFLKTRFGMENLTTSSVYKHVLSHQIIFTTFTLINEDNTSIVEEEGLKYYPLKKINDLPKPVLISRFLKDFDFL
jgi:A/G-specific adenine glycosylase